MFDLNTYPAIEAHPLICDPRNNEERDQVATPVVDRQTKPRDQQKEKCHPVAEAVLACEYVKELLKKNVCCRFTPPLKVLAQLREDLFLRHGPSNGCDRERQHENHKYLLYQLHFVCR